MTTVSGLWTSAAAMGPNNVKVFHCDSCDNLVFFENTLCVACNSNLAYLPGVGMVSGEATYRLCANYSGAGVCNWAVPKDDAHELCQSCRLTEVIPDVGDPKALEAWRLLEVAKRRLLFTLMSLKLPIDDRTSDPTGGLAFQFLSDSAPTAPVLTGHNEGVITINIAEADDVERERRRNAFGEPYRTVLGHMRHEIGHYYWNRLVRGTAELGPFRQLFGDESIDYADALRRHYEQGAPTDWQSRFVSAYASAHPWEDWAETWAHYLHVYDTVETAAACGVSLRPRRRDEPALAATPNPAGRQSLSFDQLIASWFPLTYMLNNLTRGLGQPDAYPFVLSTPALDKLRFVHELIERLAPPNV
jgi:hypothetical protein